MLLVEVGIMLQKVDRVVDVELKKSTSKGFSDLDATAWFIASSKPVSDTPGEKNSTPKMLLAPSLAVVMVIGSGRRFWVESLEGGLKRLKLKISKTPLHKHTLTAHTTTTHTYQVQPYPLSRVALGA